MTSPAPRVASGFRALGVPADLCDALAEDGITEPFDIQTACLPAALAGRDLCGRAPTGSGKTLAFGIPMLATVAQAEPYHPTGIILVPTRELAKQVRFDLLSMGKARRRYILAVYGGTPYAGQLNSFKLGASILVACPGRLLDFVRRQQLSLDAVKMCVIDEADRLADLGFMEDVKALLDAMPPARQTLLFSATLDGDVDDLVKNYQRQPERVDVISRESEAAPARHLLMQVRPIEKVGVAAKLVRQYGRTIVFTRTRENADSLRDSLVASGISTGVIHGGLPQGQRERALESLRHGRIDALVATDVAARGIHVDDIELVLHWDVADDAKDYVHRSGRTARAGSAGTVVTLVTDKHIRHATRITTEAGVTIEGAPPSRERQGGTRTQERVTTVSSLAARPRAPRPPRRSPRPR
jgi:superfamily II DNA/RNA helicase